MKTYLTTISFFAFLFYAYSQSDDKSNCDIVFTYNIHDNQLSYFSHKVINGSDRIVSYFWDFGDGYTSQLADPQHVYLNEGSYVTCLTVVFENNCVATFCDTIIVDNPLLDPEQNYSISGYVYAGNALLPEGVVVLFKKVNNQYRAISYTKINNGIYAFNNLSPSQYLVYAIPYFKINTLFYPNYFPTYYGNKLLWQDAVPITVIGMHAGKNIHLLMSSDMFLGNDSLYGTVFISDSTYFEYNVYLNNWFSCELPPQNYLNLAPNQVILLADEYGKVQRFALTSHYGEFTIKHLPKKILKIRPEKCGVTSQTFSIDLNQQNNIQLVLNPNSFTIDIKPTKANQNFEIEAFPNPVINSNFIFLNISNSENPSNAEITLFDINGKVLYNQTFSHFGKETYFIPLNDCKSGTYFISVKMNNTKQTKIFIKQ